MKNWQVNPEIGKQNEKSASKMKNWQRNHEIGKQS
jgi:hypothetical protein